MTTLEVLESKSHAKSHSPPCTTSFPSLVPWFFGLSSVLTLPTLHSHFLRASSASPFEWGVTDLKVNLKYRPKALSSAGHALRSQPCKPLHSVSCHRSPVQAATDAQAHKVSPPVFSVSCKVATSRRQQRALDGTFFVRHTHFGVCLVSGTFQTSPPALLFTDTHTRALFPFTGAHRNMSKDATWSCLVLHA